MAFRHVIADDGGKFRRGFGKPQSSPGVSGSPIIQTIRRGFGKAQSSITYNVISLPAPPTILEILQSKVMWGWSGNSTTSDIKAPSYFNLTVAGTVQSATKKVGSNAFSYSGGDNSAIEFSINNTLKNAVASAGGYSIACWCRWNNFNYGGPWGMYAAQLLSDNGLVNRPDNTGSSPSQLFFGGVFNNNSVSVFANSIQLLSVNTWYHLVYEVNQSNLKLYINGALENTSANYPSGTDFWTSAQTFRLAGYAGSFSTTQLNGFLDEFYIIAGVLSQPERDYLYNSGNGNTLI